MSKLAPVAVALLLLLGGCAASAAQKQAAEQDKSAQTELDNTMHSGGQDKGHDRGNSPSAQSGSGASPSHGGSGPHK